MEIVIFIVVVVVAILVKFFIDRNIMLTEKVDNYGGMKNKYKTLTDTMTELLGMPSNRVTDITRGHIVLESWGKGTTSELEFIENFKNEVDIKWKCKTMMGTIESKWTFNTYADHATMCVEIYDNIQSESDKLLQKYANSLPS